MSSEKDLVSGLVRAGWTLRSIASKLRVNGRTLLRWQTDGTSQTNRERLALLTYLDPVRFNTDTPYGVYYFRPEGCPYVKIGEIQSQVRERALRGFRKFHPIPVDGIAWHMKSRAEDHHKKWKAREKPGYPGWFKYHPDMEQERK